MTSPPNPDRTTGFIGWIDDRFPLSKLVREHLTHYYAPKNFNFFYYFGSLALLVLVNQIVTGIFLAMHYKPSAAEAFDLVQTIMRDVPWGFLIRSLHAAGASAMFVVIYLHMLRGILYGSHRRPRELIWIFGCVLFLVLVIEAFCGYVLPWGNMSYWGVKVILSLFGTVPVIGHDLQTLLQGDFAPADATLNRLFALHVIALPLVLLVVVLLHLVALHEVGSNNPEGIEIKAHQDAQGRPLDGIPFHPYYTVKDLFGVGVFLVIFAAVVFFAPDGGGLILEPPNFTPADPLVTPAHITPSWYLGAFYAMLRSVPAFWGTQIWGVLVMGAAILVLFFLPWLDRSPVKSIRYKGWIFRVAVTLFVISFITLDFLGMQEPTELHTAIARVCTVLYFLFFLLMPWYSRLDRTRPVPDRIPE